MSRTLTTRPIIPTLLALLLTLLLTWPGLAAAARSNINAFAFYYTAAHVLVFTPEMMPQVYDDSWFPSHIERLGFTGMYDLFTVNLPTTGLVFIPLVFLPIPVGRWVWAISTLLFLALGLILLARALKLRWYWGIWLLPLAVWYAPTAQNIERLQVYTLLLMGLCLVIWAMVNNHDSLAGIVLGIMLVLKTAGVWFCLMLLLTRRWRVLFWAAIAGGGVALLSLPWVGVEAWLTYLSIVPSAGGSPKRYVTAYQTTTSLFRSSSDL